MAVAIVISFPKKSKATPKPQKKKPGQKCTVLELLRAGWPAPSGKGGAR
jgi:hypothetical protein